MTPTTISRKMSAAIRRYMEGDQKALGEAIELSRLREKSLLRRPPIHRRANRTFHVRRSDIPERTVSRETLANYAATFFVVGGFIGAAIALLLERFAT